jgi:putative PIN family toxin of toxin-antitoxin system
VLRVVIDTGALVSYVLTRGELMDRVIAAWRAGRFAALSSPQTRGELAAVLARPAIRRLSADPLDPLIEGYARFTLHVPGVLQLPGACRDPKDNAFVACAVEGEAHYLISGDRDLLDLRRYGEVGIVNPGQFLVALELCEMTAQAMMARFDRETLRRIHATIPLELATGARVALALASSA